MRTAVRATPRLAYRGHITAVVVDRQMQLHFAAADAGRISYLCIFVYSCAAATVGISQHGHGATTRRESSK